MIHLYKIEIIWEIDPFVFVDMLNYCTGLTIYQGQGLFDSTLMMHLAIPHYTKDNILLSLIISVALQTLYNLELYPWIKHIWFDQCGLRHADKDNFLLILDDLNWGGPGMIGQSIRTVLSQIKTGSGMGPAIRNLLVLAVLAPGRGISTSRRYLEATSSVKQ